MLIVLRNFNKKNNNIMNLKLKIEEYQIDFLNNLPYKLLSLFDEINIDLNLVEDNEIFKICQSFRYSEIAVFGLCT